MHFDACAYYHSSAESVTDIVNAAKCLKCGGTQCERRVSCSYNSVAVEQIADYKSLLDDDTSSMLQELQKIHKEKDSTEDELSAENGSETSGSDCVSPSFEKTSEKHLFNEFNSHINSPIQGMSQFPWLPQPTPAAYASLQGQDIRQSSPLLDGKFDLKTKENVACQEISNSNLNKTLEKTFNNETDIMFSDYSRDKAYMVMRRKNNEASRKSRLARRQKESRIMEEREQLRKENTELKALVKQLKEKLENVK